MNCALIVVPMLRAVLKYLYNTSSQSDSWFSKQVSSFVVLFPVDLTLNLHYMVAFYIAIGAIGHGFAHLMNFTVYKDLDIAIFGYWPIDTGFVLAVICFIIYSSAFENVKSSKFEYFRNSHHLSILFFLILIVHGRGYIGPLYWQWFIVPGTLYFIEKAYMAYQTSKEAKLLSATFMHPRVISLEFEKHGAFESGFQEGMYCFLKCPTVSETEMHPFTISSAPCEKTITFHIYDDVTRLLTC